MDKKIARESKVYVEKAFKKYDNKGSGAISKENMKKIIRHLIATIDEEILQEEVDSFAEESSYMVMNPKTKQLEVEHEQNTIDFPSAMAIAVKFLHKEERKTSNGFAGKGLVKLSDMPSTPPIFTAEMWKPNRKIY